MESGPFDVPADHFAHFARIKRLADVIVGAKAERFLGRLEGAKSREHDDRKMRIDLADPTQAFNAGHAGHPNIHDDGVRLFLA